MLDCVKKLALEGCPISSTFGSLLAKKEGGASSGIGGLVETTSCKRSVRTLLIDATKLY